MPFPNGEPLYTELLSKYTKSGDWRELYDAYVKGTMDEVETVTFGREYMDGKRMLSFLLMQLIKCIQPKS